MSGGVTPPGSGCQPTASAATASSQSGIPNALQLTALEDQTLLAWRDCGVDYGFGFKVAADRCPTAPHLIRRVVRSLARKGALEYARSLYNEDDGSMGAGYTLTEAGYDHIRATEPC